MLHAERTPCTLKKQSRIWQLALCSQRADEGTQLSKIDSQHLQARKRSSRGRRCVCLGKIQDPHHRGDATCERRLSLHIFSKSTGQERCDTSWDLHSAGRDRKLHSKDLFVKQHVDPLYIRAVQVLQLSRTSSSRKSSKKALRKSSTMSGLRCAGQPSNKEGCYEEASKVTQYDKQFTLRLLSQQWTRTLTISNKAYTHF